MKLTDIHRDLMSKAQRALLETGEVTVKDLGMDTKDFYVHFPGGIKQLKEQMSEHIKEK